MDRKFYVYSQQAIQYQWKKMDYLKVIQTNGIQ